MDSKPAVLITGGAQRIGLHCAQRLVEDGFRVMITCRRQRDDWTQNPPEGIDVLHADFSSMAGIHALIATLKERNVRLRALIHNASVWLDDSSEDALGQMFMVHMQAPMLLNQAFVDLADTAQGADIIHLSDHVASRGSAKHIGYSATKAGLESLSRSFAARLAPAIKVNCIAPALIMFNEHDDDAYRAKALNKSALAIEPGPEVVYQAIRYLMNNPYVTGTCLELNGGRNLK